MSIPCLEMAFSGQGSFIACRSRGAAVVRLLRRGHQLNASMEASAGKWRYRQRMTALETFYRGPVLAALKVPTFDGHLNWSNTALEGVFYGIRTAQEIDAGIQARSGSSGGDEREAQGSVGPGAGRTRRPAANVATGV